MLAVTQRSAFREDGNSGLVIRALKHGANGAGSFQEFAKASGRTFT
jgi:hypothetical protein